jgi:hypothetical protein
MINKRYTSNSNLTFKLLKLIGSPFIIQEYAEPLRRKEVKNLFYHAIKNRITLLYLETLGRHNKLYDLENIYHKNDARCFKIYDAMAQISEFLNDLYIEHAIFKSIKPFPDASVDIDTIIFDSEQYSFVIKQFIKAGYSLLGYGPQSVTFFDEEAKVGIDLYREIAVSWVIYLDKKKLRKNITLKTLPNKKRAYTLEIQADLLSMIAHSVMKEQFFSLAEYYTFLIWLNEMNKKNIDTFKRLTISNNLCIPTKSFITIAAAIHNEIFDKIPSKMSLLLRDLGIENVEVNRLGQNSFQTPYKYHSLTVSRSLLNKIREKKFKESFALQIYKMMNPYFTNTILSGIIDHVIRETY